MTVQFARELLERAIKTFAQTLVAALGVGATDFVSMPWMKGLTLAGVAALLSVLTSIASSRVGNEDSASLVD